MEEKIVIFNIEYKSFGEDTLSILKNGQFSLIDFNNLDDLIEEIVFRTCILDTCYIDCKSENICNKNGTKLKSWDKFKSINPTLRQISDIYIIESDSSLRKLKKALENKGLIVNSIKQKNIDEVLPKKSQVGYSISKGEV